MLSLVFVGSDSTALRVDGAGAEAEMWRDDGTFGVLGYVSNGEEWWLLPDVGSFSFDRGGDSVRAMVRWPGRPDVTLDAYHRVVLPMALQARGYEVLHASAVQMTCGVVILCGASGAGKSTIGYALSQRGYPQWSDDVVVLDASDTVAACVRLPFKVRLLPDAVSFLGAKLGATRELSNGSGGGMEGGTAPVAAMFMLERVARVGRDGPVQAIQLSPASAFPRVLAHAHCLKFRDIGRRRRMIEHYLKLVSRVPVFEIRFATRLNGLPLILDAIIKMVGQATS
jgi:hypothetical protein